MSEGTDPYSLKISGPARRDLGERLPESVAAAVFEFITGDLLVTPRRVGKPLRRELLGLWAARRGTYRVLYKINEQDLTVTVISVEHRRDAYRPS